MGLQEYKEKRDFKQTPEPKAEKETEGKEPRFVIQRHSARRLHYDLRLEMEGVLKSWAVPKGPSMNPDDRRLAIMTEDHPVKYLTFEGIIPKGNYGAGQMEIWDAGTYRASSGSGESLDKSLRKGNLKIVFYGKKIRGEFALVKLHNQEENQWLLIKKADQYATTEPYDSENHRTNNPKEETRIVKLNNPVKPMLAKKTSEAFDNPDWIFELKWDGYRAIASRLDNKVQLYSRNGILFNEKFQSVYHSLESIPHEFILDGEIVVLNEQGKPQFQLLQNYSSQVEGELKYYVFDLLHLNGNDIMHLPLLDRKSLINSVIQEASGIRYCDHISGMGTAFFNRAVELGMEGIIAKKADSHYFPGVRTDNWLKIKESEQQEAVICGFAEGKEGRKFFSSLILGIHEKGKLRYAGNCGSGFNDHTLKEVYSALRPLITNKNPFGKRINVKGKKITWVNPQVICEVTFSEWTKSGNMRHPVFQRLRRDKSPGEVGKEKAAKPPENKSAPRASGKETIEIDGHSIHFSNLEKIYWPDEGLRKYDLIEYYLSVSEYILPYLKDRPENLHRHPEGITRDSFYHKDTGDIMPYWVETLKVYSESNQKDIEYMICQNTATLLYLNNLGCIEINPWNSRKDSILYPDYIVVDLDPGEKNTFEEVIETAQAVKEVLSKGKIKGYCKTSGASGLHVYIPLGAKYDYDQARDFCKVICYMVHDMLPDLTSMERSPKKRKNKIYLDYLQNRKGQTLAAPYSLRPVKGAVVSTPLSWKEVKKGLKKEDFNIYTIRKRIEKEGDIFSNVLEQGIDMTTVLENLQ